MQKNEDLIRENNELRSRLELAEKWMRREVQDSISKVQSEQSKKGTRKALGNMFETEGLDILTRRILTQFDDSLDSAPKYTLERLIDAEIYWNTLQRYPQMDALPIILAYQKIFDAWIEEELIARFRHRECSETKRGDPGTTHKDSYGISGLLRSSQGRELVGLEMDIQNIFDKKYTLSIGRFYQIISLIREGGDLVGHLGNLVSFWKDQNSNMVDILISDEFFIPFTELMEREVFTRKRHESKVNYSDAKRIREIMIDETAQKSFLEVIFSL